MVRSTVPPPIPINTTQLCQSGNRGKGRHLTDMKPPDRVWLRTARRLRGWTQLDAAMACGVSMSTISHIERGLVHSLRLEIRERIRSGIGV